MGDRIRYATEEELQSERERFWSEHKREAVVQGAVRGLGDSVPGTPLGLASTKAMGGSAFGPELPADRMTALVDVLRAKTPAGKLSAIEAGIRAGHVTLAEALEWMGGE